MSIRVTGNAIPALVGAASLKVWQDWRVVPGISSGSVGIAWTGHAISRHLPHAFHVATAGQAPVWRKLGNVDATFEIVVQNQVLKFQSIAGAASARECVYNFTPYETVPSAIDFLPTWLGVVEPAPGVEPPLAVEVMAWIRKMVVGPPHPGARQFIGFANCQDLNWSRRIARIGVMGDATGGFRFGSINCPDAPVGAQENGQSDIDVNAVQPGVLVNPGLNWFHVRIKCIPASHFQTGRFLAFLNGRLVATFDQADNFPRNSRGSGDAFFGDYWTIQPTVAMWGNPDGVSQDAGIYVRDLRVRYTEDHSIT